MAQMLAGGQSAGEVANHFNVTVSTVEKANQEFNYSRTREQIKTVERRRAKDERRAQMAELVRSGTHPGKVAAQFKVGIGTVHDACQRNGVRWVDIRRDTTFDARNAKWDAIDWNLRDAQIARTVGVSREYIRQKRLELGKQSPIKTSKFAACVEWLKSNDTQGRSAGTISELSGFTIGVIRRAADHLELTLRGRSTVLTKAILSQMIKADPVTGCWNWIGASAGAGYGRYGSTYAHRAAFQLYNGPVAADLWVLHKCDNPKCVNPDHLYAGTPYQNTQDAINRGRFPQLKSRLIDRLGHETVERVVAAYRGGKPVKEISRAEKLPLCSIYKLLRQAGVECNRQPFGKAAAA